MKTVLALGVAVALLVASSRIAYSAGEENAGEKPKKPRVEVCFVLDTTGSMGGLIEGAKAKIWSIANDIIKRKPTPDVKIALIGYRDRGDEYVTRRFDLTEDIDAVFKNLTDFKATGGGDTPESVNQALDEAVNQVAWSKDRSVLKVIFLVGDAPPHMNYTDDKKYPDVCREAVKKDLIINTVQCGSIGGTAEIWREIARGAEGEYVALQQTGNMVVVKAPQDEEIAKLNAALGKTLVPVAWGEGAKWDDADKEVKAKQALSESAPAAVAADRVTYNMRGGRAVQKAGAGEIELIDGVANKTINLADVKDEQLPPEMRKMSKEEREAYVAKKQKERADIQAKIAELGKAREAYLEGEKRKAAEAAAASPAAARDAFDAKVGEIINKQAEAKK